MSFEIVSLGKPKESEKFEIIENAPEKKEESNREWLTRQLSRTAEKTLVETPLETVESVGQTAKSLSPVDWFLDKIGRTKLTQDQLNELKDRVAKYNIHVPGVSPPLMTSEGAKKSIEEIVGTPKGYFDPQTESEQFFDESIKNAETMLFGRTSLPRAVIGGFGGESAKKLTEATLGKGVAPEVAKQITMMTAQMLNPKGATKLAASYYEKARNAMPRGIFGDTSKLETELNNLKKEWMRGGDSFDTRQAIKQSEELEKLIKNGKLEYDEAWEFKRKLNQNTESLYTEAGADSTGIKKAKEKIGQLRDTTKKFLKQSESTHPDFYSNMSKGDEIYETINSSHFISNWIKDKFPFLKSDKLIGTLFGAAEAGISKSSPIAGLAGVGAFGTYNAVKLANQVYKSPVLRKYYMDVFKNASLRNSAGFLNSYNRFKKEYEKESKGLED